MHKIKIYLLGLLLVGSLAIAICSGVKFFREWSVYNDSRYEYDKLRTLELEQNKNAQSLEEQGDFKSKLAEINSDYVGWLKIADTQVDYPVVRGKDNSKYLDTSFEGKWNALGSIFMDYRCTEDFSCPHVLVYGHKAKNGTMFGGLKEFLNSDYLSMHPEIIVKMQNDQTLVYRIFSCRKTDISDYAYKLDFEDENDFSKFAEELGAPAETSHIITLSTCVNSTGDERLLVHAAR